MSNDSWEENETAVTDAMVSAVPLDDLIDTACSDDPAAQAAFAQMTEEDRATNRRYAMTLAAVRNAFGLTQNELADRMGVAQSRISESEHRPDMLISTLASYLGGLGLSPRFVVDIEGQGEVEVTLAALAGKGTTST
ncbi:MAG: helix-turn-helix domain-containing protein [Acidimicrobiales bacterium]